MRLLVRTMIKMMMMMTRTRMMGVMTGGQGQREARARGEQGQGLGQGQAAGRHRPQRLPQAAPALEVLPAPVLLRRRPPRERLLARILLTMMTTAMTAGRWLREARGGRGGKVIASTHPFVLLA